MVLILALEVPDTLKKGQTEPEPSKQPYGIHRLFPIPIYKHIEPVKFYIMSEIAGGYFR